MKIHCEGCPDCRKANIEFAQRMIGETNARIRRTSNPPDISFWEGYRRALEDTVKMIKAEIY